MNGTKEERGESYFYPLSGQVLDIRSAGPDQKLWTDDDLSCRKGD